MASRPTQPIDKCDLPPPYTVQNCSSVSSASNLLPFAQHQYETVSPAQDQPATSQSLNLGLIPIQEAGEEASQSYLDMAETLFSAAQISPQAADPGILHPLPPAHIMAEPTSQPASITAATAAVGTAIDAAVAATAAVGAASMATDATPASLLKTTAVVSEKKLLLTDNGEGTTCPVCLKNLKGLDIGFAEKHVNGCLDGTCVPLSVTPSAAASKKPAETIGKNLMPAPQPGAHVAPTTSEGPKASSRKSAMTPQNLVDYVAPTTHPSSTRRSAAINPYSLPLDGRISARSEGSRLASALGRLGLARGLSNIANRSVPTVAPLSIVSPVPRVLSVPRAPPAHNPASPVSVPNDINADPLASTPRAT